MWRMIVLMFVCCVLGCDSQTDTLTTDSGEQPTTSTPGTQENSSPAKPARKINNRPEVATDEFESVGSAVDALTLATEAQFDEDRYRATEWLVMQGDKAVEPLAAEVSDDSASTRTQIVIARILGRIGTSSAARELEQMSSREDQMGAINAIQQLGAIEPSSTETIETLIALLGHEDARRRLEAVKALGKIGPRAEAAGDPLIAIQNGNDSDTLREAAQRALKQVKPRKTLVD